jgi:glycosyltransferase involved in cell wall biosynthesis
MSLNARAERLLGVDSSSIVYSTYYLTSNFDKNLSKWYSIKIVGKLIPFWVFIKACVTADRLHFYCDRGIIPSIRPFRFNLSELYIYRLLGIQVFLWTYGADVRSKQRTLELGEPNCCTNCATPLRGCLCDETARVKQIQKLKSLSNAIFSMGDMTEYTPGSRNDLFFWPVDINGDHGNKYQPVYPPAKSDKPLRIVHAPNHRMFKGTQYLIDAVNTLQNEGQSVELILVEKVPNENALEIYRTADIIFDQCLIGFHGYFALEGMAMGKPVMCFIRKPSEYLLDAENCPIINVHRNTLQEDIKYYIKNRNKLNEIGQKSRQYIEKYFTLEAFAERLSAAYQQLGIKP